MGVEPPAMPSKPANGRETPRRFRPQSLRPRRWIIAFSSASVFAAKAA